MSLTADALAITADSRLSADGRFLVVTPGHVVSLNRVLRVARAIRSWLISA